MVPVGPAIGVPQGARGKCGTDWSSWADQVGGEPGGVATVGLSVKVEGSSNGVIVFGLRSFNLVLLPAFSSSSSSSSSLLSLSSALSSSVSLSSSYSTSSSSSPPHRRHHCPHCQTPQTHVSSFSSFASFPSHLLL